MDRRKDFNPRIDASHKVLAYSLDCQKRHEGKYEAPFFPFLAGNMEQVSRYDMTLKIGSKAYQ